MNDGLVCELARLPGDEYALFVVDPVGRNRRRELPALPTNSAFWATDTSPTVVVSVDTVARSFRVFLLVFTKQGETEMYVYESSTGRWLGLAGPPKGLAEEASAVVYRGVLYVVFNTLHPNTMCSLLSYNLQEDMWRVLKDVPRCCHQEGPDPQVFVRDDELWMTRWYHNLDHRWMEDDLYFGLAKIWINDDASVKFVPIMETPRALIDYRLGEPSHLVAFAYLFLSTLSHDSDDPWDPVVWMSDLSGKVILCKFVENWVDVLPAHPVGPSKAEELSLQADVSDERDVSYAYYRA